MNALLPWSESGFEPIHPTRKATGKRAAVQRRDAPKTDAESILTSGFVIIDTEAANRLDATGIPFLCAVYRCVARMQAGNESCYMSAGSVRRALAEHGIELTEDQVRYRLRWLVEHGYIKRVGKKDEVICYCLSKKPSVRASGDGSGHDNDACSIVPSSHQKRRTPPSLRSVVVSDAPARDAKATVPTTTTTRGTNRKDRTPTASTQHTPKAQHHPKENRRMDLTPEERRLAESYLSPAEALRSLQNRETRCEPTRDPSEDFFAVRMLLRDISKHLRPDSYQGATMRWEDNLRSAILGAAEGYVVEGVRLLIWASENAGTLNDMQWARESLDRFANSIQGPLPNRKLGIWAIDAAFDRFFEAHAAAQQKQAKADAARAEAEANKRLPWTRSTPTVKEYEEAHGGGIDADKLLYMLRRGTDKPLFVVEPGHVAHLFPAAIDSSRILTVGTDTIPEATGTPVPMDRATVQRIVDEVNGIEPRKELVQ